MLSNGCLSLKKIRSIESHGSNSCKKHRFPLRVGGIYRMLRSSCWDTPECFQLAWVFKKWKKKTDSFGEQSAQIARLGKKDKLSTAPEKPLHGKKQNWSNFPPPFQNGLEKGKDHSKALSPIYSFVITQFIFLGYNKKNFRISQQQRIETAHQVAREIFKPCHPQRPRHPQHATVETVALFNWWPPLPTSAAQTTYIHGGLPRSFNHHHCQSTITMLAFENKPLFTTVTIVFVFCSEKPNWRVNNLANVSKKEFSVIWSSFNPKGCFSPGCPTLVSFPKLLLCWIVLKGPNSPKRLPAFLNQIQATNALGQEIAHESTNHCLKEPTVTGKKKTKASRISESSWFEKLILKLEISWWLSVFLGVLGLDFFDNLWNDFFRIWESQEVIGNFKLCCHFMIFHVCFFEICSPHFTAIYFSKKKKALPRNR